MRNKSKNVSVLLILVSITVFGLLGCASSGSNRKSEAMSVFYAVAEMKPTKGNHVGGKVYFSEGFGKVKVVVDVTGLDPNSKHGFHIHEFGDCSSPDGTNAGAHFNPMGHDHAAPHMEKRHAGDLGNLTSDAKGNAKTEFEVYQISLFGDLNPIIGRGVIIHKNPDDLISQPTGGAGARMACGVIGAAARPK